jgi:N-dimethylarginine dimethylaminohydrolase
MNQGNTNSIPVNIPSEFATLRKVVMGQASPISVFSFLRHGGLDIAAIYQLWYNKWVISHDYQRVRQQHRAFIEVMESNGVEVFFVEAVPDCPTQLYPRDIGFAIDDTFFVASPRRRFRQRERDGLRSLLPRFSRVARLESGMIEGGDVIVDEQHIIVGLGEETHKEGIDCLRRKCRELRIDRDIITLEFAHRGIIHLDTRFNIPSRGIGLVHPKSFKTESLKWLENHFDLIVAPDEETANVEINTFALSPRKLVMHERSHRLASLLESKGIETILIDFSEVTKLPGSFRCATLPIEREKHGAR